MTITVYTVTDLCAELARRRGRALPYKPAHVYKLLAAYWKEKGIVQTRYFATEEDVQNLVKWKKRRGRPRKADNS